MLIDYTYYHKDKGMELVKELKELKNKIKYMNLELTLMELNDLYYVVSKGVESHKELVEIAKRTTPELEKYFEKELSKSVQLLDKIQTVLHNEYQVMDDEPEYDSAGFTEDDRMQEVKSEKKLFTLNNDR